MTAIFTFFVFVFLVLEWFHSTNATSNLQINYVNSDFNNVSRKSSHQKNDRNQLISLRRKQFWDRFQNAKLSTRNTPQPEQISESNSNQYQNYSPFTYITSTFVNHNTFRQATIVYFPTVKSKYNPLVTDSNQVDKIASNSDADVSDDNDFETNQVKQPSTIDSLTKLGQSLPNDVQLSLNNLFDQWKSSVTDSANTLEGLSKINLTQAPIINVPALYELKPAQSTQYQTWMADIFDSLKSKKLYEITFPGTVSLCLSRAMGSVVMSIFKYNLLKYVLSDTILLRDYVNC